jgi:hypothetical protein
VQIPLLLDYDFFMTPLAVWQDYVMSALSEKTVLLVTHQVDFLPIFDSILVGISLALALSLPLSLMFYVQL